MKIGLFSDSYFPQVSGVATSIKTLKEALESRGHEVYIFTTTDPNATKEEEGIYRMPSVPFVSFKDRRIVVRGMYSAYKICKELQLDLIHTQTEFGVGILGKFVAHQLKIPCLHTYHTMYEDYLHYIAKGKLIRPVHVKLVSRAFSKKLSGIICPSLRVVETLKGYGIQTPFRVIPTGINLAPYQKESSVDIKKQLGFTNGEVMLLSLSRLSYEKNIQEVIKGFVEITKQIPKARLVIAGKGPYEEALKDLVSQLQLQEKVFFVGEVPHEKVHDYYQSADYFVSCSTSESQGLTYIEALVSKLPCVVCGNEYIDTVFNHPAFGMTFVHPKDFSEAFLSYYENKQQGINELDYQEKLYNLSADKFADEVLAFYNIATGFYQSEMKKNQSAKIVGMKKSFWMKKDLSNEEEE